MKWEVFKPKEETVYDRSFYCTIGDQVMVIDVIEFKDTRTAELFYRNPHKPSIPPVDVDVRCTLNDSFNQIFEDLNDEVWVVRVITIFNIKKYDNFDTWVEEYDRTLPSPTNEEQKLLMRKAWEVAKQGQEINE